jgi:hypothetical protein
VYQNGSILVDAERTEFAEYLAGVESAADSPAGRD